MDASLTPARPDGLDPRAPAARTARALPRAGRTFLGALIALLVTLLVGSAVAQTRIDPSAFTTQTGTLLGFLERNASNSAALACYNRGSKPDSSFTCLREAVRVAGLDDTLQGNDALTLFAPTDAAFATFATLYGQRSFLRLMNDPEKLTQLLRGTLVPGRLSVRSLESRVSRATGRTNLTTLAGTELRIQFDRLSFNRPRTEVAVGSGRSRAWQAYVSGRSTVLDNGAVVPLDMVVVPDGF
jgi:uncharacterized surface protein with fasciclin (FAS1) repeats